MLSMYGILLSEIVLGVALMTLLFVHNATADMSSDPSSKANSEMQPGPPERTSGPADQKTVSIIQGDVLRVEYDSLIIQPSDGHEVRLQFDEHTEMVGYIGPGERIEAKVNEQRHALSVRQIQ